MNRGIAADRSTDGASAEADGMNAVAGAMGSRGRDALSSPTSVNGRAGAVQHRKRRNAPGLDNPPGSRALNIHEGGRDTIYRIHGSPETWTIGKAVSSGCIRLLNQGVIHLHDEVRDGSPIVVIPGSSKTATA